MSALTMDHVRQFAIEAMDGELLTHDAFIAEASENPSEFFAFRQNELELFAELVAAAERKKCASLADGWAAVRKSKYGGAALRNFAAALRGDDGACVNNKSLDEMLAKAYAAGQAAERERMNQLIESSCRISAEAKIQFCAGVADARADELPDENGGKALREYAEFIRKVGTE